MTIIKTGQRVERIGLYRDIYGKEYPFRKYRGTVPPHPTRKGESFYGMWVGPISERRQQVLFLEIKKVSAEQTL